MSDETETVKRKPVGMINSSSGIRIHGVRRSQTPYSTMVLSSPNLEVTCRDRFPQLFKPVSTDDRLLIRERGRVDEAGVEESSSSQHMRFSPISTSSDPCRAFANAKDVERSVQALFPGSDPVDESGVGGNEDVETCRGM